MLSSVVEVWIGECGIIATLEVPWSGQIRDGFPGFEDEGHLDVFRAGRALKTWPIFSATHRRLFGSITRSGGLPEPYRRSGVAGAFGRELDSHRDSQACSIASSFWAHSRRKRKSRLYFIDFKAGYLVPGGGVEPPREVVSADFESAASASSAIPAWGGNVPGSGDSIA